MKKQNENANAKPFILAHPIWTNLELSRMAKASLSMDLRMFLSRHYLQIFNSVVRFIFINMMYMLFWVKRSPYLLFNNHSVLKEIPFRIKVIIFYIPLTARDFPTLPSRMLLPLWELFTSNIHRSARPTAKTASILSLALLPKIRSLMRELLGARVASKYDEFNTRMKWKISFFFSQDLRTHTNILARGVSYV